jgi:hypothetical protein
VRLYIYVVLIEKQSESSVSQSAHSGLSPSHDSHSVSHSLLCMCTCACACACIKVLSSPARRKSPHGDCITGRGSPGTWQWHIKSRILKKHRSQKHPPKHTFQSSTSSHSPVVVDDLDMQPVARLCALREELQRSEGAQRWADVAEPGSQRLPIILVGRLHGGRRS